MKGRPRHYSSDRGEQDIYRGESSFFEGEPVDRGEAYFIRPVGCSHKKCWYEIMWLSHTPAFSAECLLCGLSQVVLVPHRGEPLLSEWVPGASRSFFRGELRFPE